MSSARRTIGNNPTVAMRSNWLRVNNRTLHTNVLEYEATDKLSVSAEELERVLILGRRTIVTSIEEFYLKQVAKNPGSEIVRPSIWTAQIGTSAQTEGRDNPVFTAKGYANGGVNRYYDEIQPAFRAHWGAIARAGFLPEVRRTETVRDGGAWLLLRKPTLDEVLSRWFGWDEGIIDNAVEVIKDDDKDIEQRKLHLFRKLGEKAVDRAPDPVRSREQIGLIMAMGAIKLSLGDKEGYEVEVDDALTYADDDDRIDVSIVRAIENSTFELD